MPEAKHTPGPWKLEAVDPNGWQSIYAARGAIRVATAWVSCDLSKIDDEQREANARLIAASPQLLEAAFEAMASRPAILGRCRRCHFSEPRSSPP